MFAALLAGSSSPALASPPGASSPDKTKKPTEKIGERVSRGVIQEGLETLDTPANQARIGRILSSPEVQDAVRDLTSALVLGVYDGVRAGRAGAATNRKLGKSIREGLDYQVTPALGRLSSRMTLAASHGLATGLQEDVGPALAATLERDIGPALAIVIERDLLPAIGRGLDTPQMHRVAENLSHAVASEAVEGAGEAIDEEAQDRGLQLFGKSVAVGYAVALFVAFALGTMSIVLTVVLFRNSRRLRKQSKVAAERESALLHLIDNIEAENPGLKLDARNLLEDQLEPAE